MSESTYDDRAAPARRLNLVELALKERGFLIFIGFGFFIVGMTYSIPRIAMWVGFLFAGYSAVANDSIQTIGTFLASNKHRPWWILWIFIGSLFLATVTTSWVLFDGDVTWQLLSTKGFNEAPTSFSFLQVAAPLFLLILTRLRMPVSTTFLLLSAFATKPGAIEKVLFKSLSGYVIAFALAMLVWLTLGRFMQRRFQGEAASWWVVAQWATSGTLWCAWLMQDAANIAVFLPRQLSLLEFIAFAGAIFMGLGLLFRSRGDRIQEIVNEKSGVVDVRAATIIDFVYAVILIAFKYYSKVPMSTTWVFLGLLGGRELAMSFALRELNGPSTRHALRLMGRDALFAGIGLIVSLILAAAINDAFGLSGFR